MFPTMSKRAAAIGLAGTCLLLILFGFGLAASLWDMISMARSGISEHATIVYVPPNVGRGPLKVRFVYNGEPRTLELANYADSPEPQTGATIPVRISSDGKRVVDRRTSSWTGPLITGGGTAFTFLAAAQFLYLFRRGTLERTSRHGSEADR